MDIIYKALDSNNIRVMGLAERYVLNSWQIDPKLLLDAVYQHVNDERLIFQKSEFNGPVLQNKVHANVTLFPDKDEFYADVYVELTLEPPSSIFIIDAHNHLRYRRRYPKYPYEA